MKLSRKDLWKNLLSNCMNPHERYSRTTYFKNFVSAEIQFGLNGMETGQNEGRLLDSPNSVGRKQSCKLLSCSYVLPFKKNSDSKMGVIGTEVRSLYLEDYLQDLKSEGICPAGC